MNKEFKKFVNQAGGPSKAAEILDCHKDTVQKMQAGTRRVTPRFAQIIIRRFPNINGLSLMGVNNRG